MCSVPLVTWLPLFLLCLLSHAFPSTFLPPHKLLQRPHVTLSYSDSNEYENDQAMMPFFLSPDQIQFLRKEASKRERKKTLPKLFLTPEESTEISQDTLRKMVQLLEESELIETRGVSRGEKKQVYAMAYALANVLEEEMGKPVVVVQVKGFAVKLYSPWDSARSNSIKIELRSSYRPNQWTKKPKPVRDVRGQIIKDEDGRSIKEIPDE